MSIAPTGAVSFLIIPSHFTAIDPHCQGKTDVAVLTILRVISQHRFDFQPNTPLHSTINRNAFKIIYVYESTPCLLEPT
jgi:hypothetical protein